METARRAALSLPEVETFQANRDAVLRSKPPEVVWVRELRRRIADRTSEIGLDALLDPPKHLERLLGPPGGSLSDEAWAEAAGRVEGYRERWRLKPNELGVRRAGSAAQAEHWRAVEMALPEPVEQAPRTARHVERDSGIGMSM